MKIVDSRRDLRKLVRVFGIAAAAIIGVVGSMARAATPTFNVTSTATYSHDASSTDPPGPATGSLTIFNSASPALSYNTTLSLAGVSSLGKAGIGYTSSATKCAVTWPAGMGVGQTDPPPDQGFASLTVPWDVSWTVGVGGFGPPITGSFSIPVGGTVGAGGTASYSVTANWYYIHNGVLQSPPRTPYSASMNFGPGSFLQSFTAPAAAFSPTSYVAGDIIGFNGSMTFTANNDIDPVTINLPDQFDNQILNGQEYINGFAFESLVPEPGSLSVLGLGALGLLARRRRA